MNILYHCGLDHQLENDSIITGFFCVELLQKYENPTGLYGAAYTEEFNEKMKEFK